MPSFEKCLTEVDVNKQVAIPSDFVQHLPDYEGGTNDNFSGARCFRKGDDYPKPVFQKDWRKYVRVKGLRPGDKIIFRVERNGDNGAPIYTIAAQKKIELLGFPIWGPEF
ncbi:hypothetical protein V6Z11_D01G057100 [Gossypium hirsutum]